MENLNYLMQNIEEKHLFKVKVLEQQTKKRLNLIEEKNNTIKNLEYEKDLITEDLIRIIKEEMNQELNLIWGKDSYSAYHTVWVYNQNKNNVKDQEKAKQLFKQITNTIREKILLGNKDFKLIEIIMKGYNGESYEFMYKYKKHKFGIKIPMFNTVNKENYNDMLLGYKIYYYKSEHCCTNIMFNLNYNQLANDFKQYIESLEV